MSPWEVGEEVRHQPLLRLSSCTLSVEFRTQALESVHLILAPAPLPIREMEHGKSDPSPTAEKDSLWELPHSWPQQQSFQSPAPVISSPTSVHPSPSTHFSLAPFHSAPLLAMTANAVNAWPRPSVTADNTRSTRATNHHFQTNI